MRSDNTHVSLRSKNSSSSVPPRGSQKSDDNERARMRLLASNAAARRARGDHSSQPLASRQLDVKLVKTKTIRLGSEVQSDVPPPPRPGQTFGRVEAAPYTSEEDFIQKSLEDDSFGYDYEMAGPEEKADLLAMLRKIAASACAAPLGAHPTANEHVLYSIIDWPRPDGSGTEKLTLRWWSGRIFGYYLDIVDTRLGTVCKPPNGFHVAFFHNGSERGVGTQETAMRKMCPDHGAELEWADVEERWVVPSGVKAYIYCHNQKIARLQVPFSPYDDARDHGVPEYDIKSAESWN